MQPRAPSLLWVGSLVFVALLSGSHAAHTQGSLTPPGGAPAPTMKTLDQVEVRIPLSGGNTPQLITVPGSYYLTGNLVVSGTQDAITVVVGNVTLDLNGYQVFSTASPAAGTAVLIANSVRDVTVKNGQLHGTGTVSSGGTFSGGGFAYGVRYDTGGVTTSFGEGIVVQDLTIDGCSLGGISFGSGMPPAGNPGTGRVERCTLRNVGGSGIDGAALASACAVSSCGGDGITAIAITGSSATTNGIHSLYARTVSDSFGYNNAGAYGIYGDQVHNSQGQATSSGVGVRAETASGCRAFSATGTALIAETATNCRGITNGGNVGLSAQTALNCQGTSNGGTGLSTSVAQNCQGVSTGGRGLVADIATNCTGQTTAGDVAISVVGTATNCRGRQTDGSGVALQADIAIGCTSGGGTITANQKLLGTP